MVVKKKLDVSVITLGRVKTGTEMREVYNRIGRELLGEIRRKEIDGLPWQVGMRHQRALNSVLRNLNFIF